jgi:hypothetical protein
MAPVYRQLTLDLARRPGGCGVFAERCHVRIDPGWLRALRRQPRPTAHPTTWLLAHGWRRGGLLGFDDAPG